MKLNEKFEAVTKVKAMLGASRAPVERFVEVSAAVVELATYTTESLKQLNATIAEQGEAIKEQAEQLDALSTKLWGTSDGTPLRRLANGGHSKHKTDC